MKKFILLAICAILVLILSSCGNRSVGIDINQTFSSAYVRVGDSWKFVNVRSWRDYSDGDVVQIVATDGTVYLSHYSNMVLVN